MEKFVVCCHQVLEKKEGETSDKEDAAEDENADNEELEEFYDEEEMEEVTHKKTDVDFFMWLFF